MVTRILSCLIVSALAVFAGIILPFLQHGIRNLPWEAVFGLGCYFTWFFRHILGEHLEVVFGLLVWPVAVIILLWVASFRIFRARIRVRVTAASVFFISLFICVPAETANELGSRIPLYLNELSVRY
jgi:predicted benzoate:H+ symporter BenE